MKLSLGMIINSLWVLKLNIYETMESNSLLRMSVLFNFYFISHGIATLETIL